MLLAIVFVLFLGWCIYASLKKPKVSKLYIPQTSESAIRYKIAEEIRAQSVQYTGKAQKQVVEDMAQTIEYFAVNSYQSLQTFHTMPHTMDIGSQAHEENTNNTTEYETPWKKLQLLDSATILLYLGAFFLLASIGLYVGLGSGEGIKPVLVAVISAVFYVGGLWLYNNSARLKPAGLTFAGIGMASLPMVGVATYYYALHQTYGPAVWLATSLFAVAMYVHAIRTLRSTLVSYLIVFSTLSLVLSGISSVGLAPLYFIQGMGFAGLVFAFLARLLGKHDAIVAESYDRSAMFLVPFSVGMGALFAIRAGWLNTALSFALGATYYAYQALFADKNKEAYSAASQISAIGSVLSVVYAATHSSRSVAVVAGLLSVIYIGVWLGWAVKKPKDNLYRVCTKAILLVLPLASFVFVAAHANIFWLPTLLLLVVSIIVYATDRDEISGALFVLSVLLLPYFVGVLGRGDPLSAPVLGIVYVAVAAAAVAVRSLLWKTMTSADVSMYRTTLAAGIVVGAILQSSAGNGIQVAVSVVEVMLVFAAAFCESESFNWLAYGAILQLAWLVAFVDNARLMTAMVAFAAICNVVLALLKKLPLHTWLAICLGLAFPLLYGFGVSEPKWSGGYFCIVYLLLSTTILALRYLLRKRTLSHEIIIALQFGYAAALATAIVFSTSGGYGSMAISLFVAGLILTAVSYIESSAVVIVLAFAAGYGSLLRLLTGYELSLNASVGIFVAVSQSVYWLLRASGLDTLRAKYSRITQIVVAGAIPLVGVAYFDHSVFALSLAVFGAILAREVWQKSQGEREAALLVVYAALLWWLYGMGVREIQVYTQSTAAVVGLFAWWRRQRQDLPATINNYLWTSVSIFTVPMVLQAISSGNTTYSYMILVEHILLILVSIAYKRATFAWWGIGVVVVSVLYQMRRLKYAALAFLGAFVISLAIYFLLKSSKTVPKK
jgi:hypothetical protein